MAATHYAAYRPPLHEIILQRVLSEDESFEVGLDVGCGTGYSAIALTRYCARVYGIDPSPSMLGKATAHDRVIYQEGAAERIPLRTRSVNIVTFAGSLFYADVDATSEEIRRVSRDGAVVVAYDFEVLIDAVLQQCRIAVPAGGYDYNHSVNFSSAAGFRELAVGTERVSVSVTAHELAHVLLSDSSRLDQFAERYRASDPFPALAGDLQSVYRSSTIQADIYYSQYRITGA